MNIISKTHIPDKIKLQLWVKSGGRCQYDGCNEMLWRDDLTWAAMNAAYIAHIIADSPDGPRGDKVLSPLLAQDPENLMLMCDKHHRLIDKEDEAGHPPNRLQEMKRKHEDRIALLTSIKDLQKSHVLLYGANIGGHSSKISWKQAAQAMIPDRYPSEPRGIELSLGSSMFQDHEPDYWKIEETNLDRQFNQKVLPRLQTGDINHLSIFGLAPQPLLIKLGTLCSDIIASDIYQLHRNPQDWCWQHSDNKLEYIIEEPSTIKTNAALIVSLSATVTNDRIFDVLGKDTSIWKITIPEPFNDYLKSKIQLIKFSEAFRRVLDNIKAIYGQEALLNIFPATPVSVAIEMGRAWMPKADMPLLIYDQNSKVGGFIPTIEIYNRGAI